MACFVLKARHSPHTRASLRPVYTVEISPSAWIHLAQLSVETYRRIREELDAIAAALTHSGEQGLSPAQQEATTHRSPVVVDSAVARYDVDHAHRRVLLLEVSRR